MILLQQVDHLSRQEVGNLLALHARDVGHKLEVVDEVGLFLGRVQLELLQFLNENVEMDLELLLVVVCLTLYFVLKLKQSHRCFILVKRKGLSILLLHQAGHISVFCFLSGMCIGVGSSTPTSPLVCFNHSDLGLR